MREDVTFESQGSECAAWLYRPPGSERAPCVVMAHGFSATRRDGLEPYAERFAAAGLAALVFDYRHFGDSGGQPRQLLDIRRQIADYRAAVRFARACPGLDAARIALWGSSFSGGHVLTLAAEDQAVAAVVAQCPFLDGLGAMLAARPRRNALRGTVEGLRDLVGSWLGHPPRMIPVVGPPGSFATMNAPEALPGFEAIVAADSKWRNEIAARFVLTAPSYRPIQRASLVSSPTLLCACERDQTTPPEWVHKAASGMKRAEVKSYPVGHFEIYTGEAWERAVSDQVDFLRRHLLPS